MSVRGPTITCALRLSPGLRRELGRRLRRAALRLGVAPEEVAGIALHIVDDAAIARLNRLHMGKRGPTDVLSFPSGTFGGRGEGADFGVGFDFDLEAADEDEDAEDDATDADGEALALGEDDAEEEGEDDLEVEVEVAHFAHVHSLGDIVLSWPAVIRQARRRDLAGLLDEATVLAVHGLAHLLGHDHRERREGR
ncbi:MAG: rRNA maturation RNAse YbeY, partial [Myxococcales bacterium]|nr:rRNA maturation RNAse YbeY [Myxococcales bacterium]